MNDNPFQIDTEQALRILVRPKDFLVFEAGTIYSQKYIADVIAQRRFNKLIWDTMTHIATEKLRALNAVWGIPDEE
jgi:cAMP phosphodiesterase